MTPSTEDLFAALDATWPPAAARRLGPFTLCDGAGGGKRVSATRLEGAFDIPALDRAESAMRAPFLFQARAGQEALDTELAARGYALLDPTVLYAAPVDLVAAPPRPVSLLGAWPPLAIQRQLWLDGHIGPERLAVMERACGPKQSFIARFQNRAAGVGFVAIHQGIALLHALQVEPAFRRQGVARYMVRGMADWARENGAHTFALAVTRANATARALYTDLGMVEAGSYHYREKQP